MYIIVYILYLATTLGKQGSHFVCTKTSRGKIIISIDIIRFFICTMGHEYLLHST